MESQSVRRRMNMVAGHLASHEEISATATATQLFPMICSNSLNSVLRRCDNRMYFARQCSNSQGCFMRQSSYEQANSSQSSVPLKPEGSGKECSGTSEMPMFSRPTMFASAVPSVKGIPPVVQGCRYTESGPEAPKYARPNRSSGEIHCRSEQRTNALNELKWSPRMNVMESRGNYIVTLELPGVNIDGIKVEVSDQVLTVSGNRSIQSWRAEGCSNQELTSSYQKKEILQGPYQIVWPLPATVDKNNISAEFLNGLLQITVPKLSDFRWLRKAHM